MSCLPPSDGQHQRLTSAAVDPSDEILPGKPLTANRFDYIVNLQPSLIGGLTGLDAPDLGFHDRADAQIAHLEFSLGIRRHAKRARLPIGAEHDNRELTFGARHDRYEQLGPCLGGLPFDAQDSIANLDADELGRRVLHDVAHDRRHVLIGRNLRALIEHERHHDDGEHDVHDRSHDEHLEPLPLRARHELVGRAGSRVVGVLAGHLHVATKRNRAEAVLRVTPGET